MKQIIFVHGIMGSVLNENSKKVWPVPIIENMSARRYDILMDLNNENIKPYKLEQISYKKITKFIAEFNEEYIEYIYDWRKNNLEHLDDLFEKLNPNVEEIYIIAHSMGGIIAKLMLNKFKTHPLIEKVKSLITIGTPWYGSIDSVKTLTFGKQIPDFMPIALCKNSSKRIAKHFPSIYQLIPSADYYERARDSLGNPCSCFNLSGNEISDFDSFYEELLKKYFEENNHTYLEVFDSYYDMLNKNLPESVIHHEIVGVGKKTISSMKINSLDEAIAERYDGDGTVPLFSAYSNKADSTYFVNKASHVGLVKNDHVLQLVSKIIEGNEFVENEFIFKSLESPYYKKFTGKVIKVACPVEIAVLNEDGEAIYGSLDSIDDEIFNFANNDEKIVYEELGTTKYIIIDEDEEKELPGVLSFGNESKIRIQATDTGPTSVGIESFVDGELLNKKAFKTFEINTNKEAILTVGEDFESSKLEVKIDSEDIEIINSTNIVFEEILILPETELELSNQKQRVLDNGIDSPIIVLEDNTNIKIRSVIRGSYEIDKTFIKINDKIEFFQDSNDTIYLDLKEGMNEILYFSKDIADNFENEKVIYIYKLPLHLYKLSLQFLPHKYTVDLNYHGGYELLLEKYGQLDDKKITWTISEPEHTLNDWIFYQGLERVIKIKYTDLFNEIIENQFTVDESTIANIIEGRVEKDEFLNFLPKLNASGSRVKMHIDNSYRYRKINNDNLRIAKMFEFEGRNIHVVIKKSTSYELCWNNLREEVTLDDNNNQMNLKFTILDKDNKKVNNLDLKYFYTYEVSGEMKYTDESDVLNFNDYECHIDLKELVPFKDELEYFEVNVLEKETGNNIRIQKIFIRK